MVSRSFTRTRLAVASNRTVSVAVLASLCCLDGVPTAWAQDDVEQRELVLDVGEQTTLPAEGIESFSEGAPGIVDVRVPRDGTTFVIVALRPGTTSLLLIRQQGGQIRYAIRVRDPNAPATRSGFDVGDRENIRLDFYFVQLSETYSHQIGIGWPGTIGGPGVLRASATVDMTDFTLTSATASVVNQPLPRLDIAQSNGWARLMRQAVLVTANGNNARFVSGGEVNVPVQGALTAEIRTIPFGSEVQVTPRYDSESSRVELTIEADVSDLTDSSGGVPGRTVTKLRTLVNLEVGQAILLAGLVGDNVSQSQTGFPGLSQIPILGALFGSISRRHLGVENLLFIVPTVVEAVSRENRDYVAEALRVYRAFDGGLDDWELVEPVPAGYR